MVSGQGVEPFDWGMGEKYAAKLAENDNSSYLCRLEIYNKLYNSIMLVTTTPTVEGYPIKTYLGVVTGETIIGANAFKDLAAAFTDIFGGRSSAYERTLQEAKETSLQEMQQRAAQMGANAVVGVDLDYETIGSGNSMLMVACSGTAVII